MRTVTVFLCLTLFADLAGAQLIAAYQAMHNSKGVLQPWAP